MPVHKQSSQRLQQQGLALDTDRQFFRCLRENGPMSRAAISQLTGISRPTISEAAGRLQGQSLVNETKKKTQSKKLLKKPTKNETQSKKVMKKLTKN